MLWTAPGKVGSGNCEVSNWARWEAPTVSGSGGADRVSCPKRNAEV
jgi:hypothetical protein